MRVLVAGATGVIGRPLVSQLQARGHEVTGLTRSEERAEALRSRGADAIVCDVLAPEVELVPVCPEVEAGFGVPREPVRLVKRGTATHMIGVANWDISRRLVAINWAWPRSSAPMPG